MGNNKHISKASATVNCIPPAPANEVQGLVSNCCASPEGPECDALEEAEQTAAPLAVRLTFLFPLTQTKSITHSLGMSVSVYSIISLDDMTCHLYTFRRMNDAK